jgi:hypothetical protein
VPIATFDELHAWQGVAVAYARIGQVSRAIHLLRRFRFEDFVFLESLTRRSEAREFASAAVGCQAFTLAFSVLEFLPPSDLLRSVVNWSPWIESAAPGLFPELLQQISRILSWADSTYDGIGELLKEVGLLNQD